MLRAGDNQTAEASCMLSFIPLLNKLASPCPSWAPLPFLGDVSIYKWTAPWICRHTHTSSLTLEADHHIKHQA